jgi:hypothetical protein
MMKRRVPVVTRPYLSSVSPSKIYLGLLVRVSIFVLMLLLCVRLVLLTQPPYFKLIVSDIFETIKLTCEYYQRDLYGDVDVNVMIH